MLAMVGDRLMIAVTKLERQMVAIGAITQPPAWREGFTNPTNPILVFADTVKIIGEVTRRLRTLEHELSTDRRRRFWPKRWRSSSKPADQAAG